MIHLTGAMGRDANDSAGHAVATRPERDYRVTRRGWPSSEVSRPLLPLNPPNGGAPGMSETSARTGVATDALSVEAGGVSRTRGADSATSSDRAADGSGLNGGGAGGPCTMAGCGEGVAGCEGGATGFGRKSASRERSIRGRGAGAARRTSFLGSGVGGAGGRARSRVGAITGGAAGTGVRGGASSSTGLHSVEYPVSATGIARSAIAAMLARKANGLRRPPTARATRS
jgi:hypothetical protein